MQRSGFADSCNWRSRLHRLAHLFIEVAWEWPRPASFLWHAGVPYLILDNFCNSRRSVLERLGRITGAQPQCIEGDVRDADLLRGCSRSTPLTA
jgi:hypothetical protein